MEIPFSPLSDVPCFNVPDSALLPPPVRHFPFFTEVIVVVLRRFARRSPARSTCGILVLDFTVRGGAGTEYVLCFARFFPLGTQGSKEGRKEGLLLLLPDDDAAASDPVRQRRRRQRDASRSRLPGLPRAFLSEAARQASKLPPTSLLHAASGSDSFPSEGSLSFPPWDPSQLVPPPEPPTCHRRMPLYLCLLFHLSFVCSVGRSVGAE